MFHCPRGSTPRLHDLVRYEMEGSFPMRRVSVLVAVLLLLAATVGAPIAQARQAAAGPQGAAAC